MVQEEPLFNLKAVVRQTGLKPDTLRAWERRYGLPAPERSAGRHRLYSPHDINVVKWLMARQREGLSIKRAVEMWRQIEAEGRDPLQAPMPTVTATPVAAARPEGDTVTQLREGWIDACLGYDERQAEQILNQAFALYSPETVSIELLQKAVAEIGRRWYQGGVTVQQEHFCSALALRRLEALLMAAPLPNRPGRILAACPPEESHVFGLLLLTLLLRRRGWEVLYLGANVPAERLETTVAVTRPQLVILSAQQLHSAATLLDIAQLLKEMHVPMAYGGMVFNLAPDLRDRVSGHFLGERLEPAVEAVEALMIGPRPTPKVEPVPEVYLQARDHFLARQGLIEAHVVEELMSAAGAAPGYLALANRELGQNIAAALALGDMDYLGLDIEWLKGLMRNYRQPGEVLRNYLTSYYRAAERYLAGPGAPIVAWLGRMLERNGFSES